MITDNREEHTELMVMFRIISQQNWDALEAMRRACPGSTVEHLAYGLFVLTIPAGGACEETAT